jgi:cytidine diphosphoramidate kinase
MVIWLIGLAGAGKTSIGKALYQRLKADNPSTVFLDGDQVREITGNDLGHTLEDRRKNGWRICRLCAYLEQQGIDVVCATLSQFHEQQGWNRSNFARYFEVFIDVPLEVLIRRDQKGLYSGALAGTIRDVVGLDMPFPPPLAPDLILQNGQHNGDFSSMAEMIIEAMRRDRQGLSA